MKKGFSSEGWNAIAALAFILLLLLIGIIMLSNSFSKTSKDLKTRYTEIQWKSCRAQGEKFISEGVEFAHGEDNFPYSCAPCIGGNNFEDQDADGMPDDCDKEPMNNRVVECKDGKPTKDGRCCIEGKWLTWCCPFTKEYEKNPEACKTS